MSSRKQHIEEMRYAMAHNVTVLIARARLARREMIKAEVAAMNVQSCGTRARPNQDCKYHQPETEPAKDAPWMMRD